MATPAQIQQLLTQLGSLVNSFSTLERHLPGFVKNFSDYNKKFQRTGGGGGTGDDKSILQKLEAFVKSTLLGTFKKIDALATESLGRNTRLSELNLKRDLGVPISVLGDSIFDLRDSGFRNLTDSTQRLIARMKLTGQSTSQLTEFLAENSYYLNLNNQESQVLVDSIAKSGQLYQISQQKTLEALNLISAKVGEDLGINLVGGTKQMIEGFTMFAQELGMRNSQAIAKTFNAFFGQENYIKVTSRIPGALDLANRILQSTNSNEIKETMKELVLITDQYMKSQMSSSRDLLTMNGVNATINETFGSENVKEINAVARALKDNKQTAVEGIRQDLTFQEIQSMFYAKVEKGMLDIHQTLQVIAGQYRSEASQGATVGAATTFGVGGAMAGRVLGKVGQALANRAAMAAVGSVLPGIGTLVGGVVGLGLFAKDLYDIYSDWSNSNNDLVEAAKSTAQSTQKSADILQEEKNKDIATKISFEETQSSRLSKIINAQIMALGPGDKSQLQAKSVELLSKMTERLDKLIEVSKDDRLAVPKGAGEGY
jgi:hypothetical protein